MRISLYKSFEMKLIRLAELEGVAPSAYVKAFIVKEFNSKFTNDPHAAVYGDEDETIKGAFPE
jgi:hypothetical protein